MDILATQLGEIDTIFGGRSWALLLGYCFNFAYCHRVPTYLSKGMWVELPITSLNIIYMNTCRSLSIDSREVGQWTLSSVSAMPLDYFLMILGVQSSLCGLIGCDNWFQMGYTVLYQYQLRESTWDQTFHLNQFSSNYSAPIKWCFY